MMRIAIALVTSIFLGACGQSDATEPDPNVELTRDTLLTYQNAVAYLPAGISEYKAAIVFLPGLRDPATGKDLDSRALVRGASGLQCSIWCLASERAPAATWALHWQRRTFRATS